MQRPPSRIKKDRRTHLAQAKLVDGPGDGLHVAAHALEIDPDEVPVPRAAFNEGVRREGKAGMRGGEKHGRRGNNRRDKEQHGQSTKE